MGIEDGRECAIMIILRREILYSEALKHGYSASHEEIMDAINSFMESLRSADNFEIDFLPFLDGLGMTYEEYWETQYDLAPIFATCLAVTGYNAFTSSAKHQFQLCITQPRNIFG